MENNIMNHFSVNYKQIIVDEIALEGLSGIVIDLLWRRIEKRIFCDLTEKMKVRHWDFLMNCSCISFYKVPNPVPRLEIVDRFTIVDDASGHLKEPEEYLDGDYEYAPVENEHGSCKDFATRKLISIKDLQSQTYQEVVSKYGDTLVMVASIEERWTALAKHVPIACLSQLTQVHYCIIELIGKARENGQMTIGKTNLIKIVKDPKTLFYHRKYLHDLDMICIDNITQNQGNNRNVKSLLVRLKRFYQPRILSMPKVGILHNIVDYLLQKPGYSEKVEVIVKEGLLTQKRSRRLQKTVNIFNFEEKMVPTTDNEKSNKKSRDFIKRRFISISYKSDESADSEEENEEPLKCQYKVGVGLLRQAYERFLDAGLQGLTQVQLAQLLGIEFYTSRAICRVFRLRNIVREFLEDKGKQRTTRYIAVVGQEDPRYAAEKQKFMEFLEQKPTEPVKIEEVPSTSSEEVPRKKIKLEPQTSTNTTTSTFTDSTIQEMNPLLKEMDPEIDIIEVNTVEGYEGVKSLSNFSKNPTLRQLTFANAVIKVIREKNCIPGFLALSSLAAKEINEPPMDTKPLKSFVQRLISDGHAKIFNIKWPDLQRYSVFICASHIQKTDPIFKAKYEEICMKAASTKKKYVEKLQPSTEASQTSLYSYPRYMKIQKLHELIMNYAYFEYVKPETNYLPQGYIGISDLIPEFTVQFAINSLGMLGHTEIRQLILTEELLKMKMKDAPQNIYNMITKSNTLHNSIRLNIKVLGMLGLVQLVRSQEASTSTQNPIYLFYVNQHAKILDTRGTWPRKNIDEEVTEKVFNFESMDNVTDYWNQVYSISTNTVIKVRGRRKKLLTPPMRNEGEAPKYDNGDRYGDGLGPCGFDSCFYMEMPKFWKTFYIRPLVTNTNKKKLKARIRKVEPNVKPPQVVKKLREKENAQPRSRIDKTIKWSKHEDTIITLCKAAITILSPNAQPGCLIVRNTVARDLLSIRDPKKTKSDCHRRAKTLDSDITLVHEKQCIINEMRRRRKLIQKYECLLKKLRLRYTTNISKFTSKCRLPMLELVWTMMQVMRSDSYNQRVPCVALNLEEFHNRFSITTATANKLFNMYRVNDHATLKEAIIMTVLLSFHNDISNETARKIYATFSKYSETMLRAAVDQLRKCGAIAAKEKILNCHMRVQNLDDITQASYKVSAFYTRKWVNRLNSEFTDKIGHILDMEQTENDINGSAEINCIFCEMTTCDIIDIASTTGPVLADAAGVPILPEETNVLAIDSKYRLKTSSLRWKNKSNVSTFAELYQHLDIVNSLDYLSRGVAFTFNEAKTKNVKHDVIITHLQSKREKGASFDELQQVSGLSEKALVEKLQLLESNKTVTRVGYYENVIVLIEFIDKWSVTFNKKYLFCTPWLTIEGKARHDIFLKWCSAVMNLIYEKPGSSITHIAEKCDCISYKAVQDICMFLEKYECIRLCLTKHKPIDLFSDPDEEPEFVDFHPYAKPDDILSFPYKNCITKFSYIKKRMNEVATS